MGTVILLVVASLATPTQGQTCEIKVWQDANHTRSISEGEHISLPYSQAGAEFKSSLHVFIITTNSALDDPNDPVYFSIDEGPGMWELLSNPHEYSGPGLENWFSAPLPPSPPSRKVRTYASTILRTSWYSHSPSISPVEVHYLRAKTTHHQFR